MNWRFIPACAGNTTVVRMVIGHSAVHPRLRGEHRPGIDIKGRPDGSSPPARGTHGGHQVD